MTTDANIRIVLSEIDEALGAWQSLRTGSGCEDCSDRPLEARMAVKGRLARTLGKLAPRGSRHEKSLRKALASSTPLSVALKTLVEALTALRREHEIRLPPSSSKPVPTRTDPLAGFLESARRLCREGCKDAAAIIAGSTLEQHLRRLCVRNGIAATGDGCPETDALNAELARHGIYDGRERDGIDALLALWDDAIHGRCAEYDAEQVRNLINAVAAFMAKHPA